MKRLLLIVLLLTSVSYADEVKFAPEIEGTKWEHIVDKDKKIVLKFETPYIVIKSYENSKLIDTSSTEMVSYTNVNNLHFFFEDTRGDSISVFFQLINNDHLQLIIVDESNIHATDFKPLSQK